MLDLVATSMEQQGQGHCRTLLRALEGWLGPELGVASLVAVCPADVSAGRGKRGAQGLPAGSRYSGACMHDPSILGLGSVMGSFHHQQILLWLTVGAAVVAAAGLQEPLNIRVFSDKFGFKRLSPKALQTLKTSVPALNYYEESTLLAKQLDKRQRLAGSKKQQQQQKQAEAGKGGKPQQDAAGSLPVQPLEGSAGGAAA